MSGVARGAHDGRNLSRPPSRTRAPAHCRRGATPCTPPTHPCRRPVHAHRHRCGRAVPGCCANADSVRWCDRRDAWNTLRKTPMAEPARSPRSRHGTRPVTFADAPAPPSAHELFARRMQDLPRLPSRAALLALTERDLPNIDDLPTPDSMYQDKVTYYTVLALQRALRHHQGVYVGGCTLVYNVGRPGEDGWISPVWIVPDAVVSFGVGSHERSSYVMWREGKPPEFVMEFASVSTWKRDRDEKPARYESLGVSEYFLYDPVGGLLEPRLQGHVLSEGRYRALRPERLPNGERGLRSEVAESVGVPAGTARGAALVRPRDRAGSRRPRRDPRCPRGGRRGARRGHCRPQGGRRGARRGRCRPRDGRSGARRTAGASPPAAARVGNVTAATSEGGRGEARSIRRDDCAPCRRTPRFASPRRAWRYRPIPMTETSLPPQGTASVRIPGYRRRR